MQQADQELQRLHQPRARPAGRGRRYFWSLFCSVRTKTVPFKGTGAGADQGGLLVNAGVWHFLGRGPDQSLGQCLMTFVVGLIVAVTPYSGQADMQFTRTYINKKMKFHHDLKPLNEAEMRVVPPLAVPLRGTLSPLKVRLNSTTPLRCPPRGSFGRRGVSGQAFWVLDGTYIPLPRYPATPRPAYPTKGHHLAPPHVSSLS